MFVATLVMLALTVLLMTRNEQFIFQNEGRLVVKPHPTDDNAVVFIWRSQVEVPMARRFEEAFDEWKGKTDRIVIDLHSPGGALAEGAAVIREIDHMRRTHVVDTRVRNRRKCYSMCVPIFLMGDERTAAPNARFMFHEPTSYDQITGEKVDQAAFDKARTSQRFFNRYFVNSPMNETWRNQLAVDWIGKDVYYSGQELMDQRSDIVTKLE